MPGNLDQIREGIDWTCNKDRLEALLASETAPLTFYCGGMANTEEVWGVFNRVVVLTVSDETTIQRLLTRQPGEFGSTKENRDWVLSWKHDVENGWFVLGGIKVSAETDPESVAKLIVDSVTKN